MPEVLTLREAARLISVSPGRLYRAIADGRLTAATGGGPGKSTLIDLAALQTFCQHEGLRVPEAADLVERPERSERVERSARAITQDTLESLASQYLAQMLARQSDYIETFVRTELAHLVSRVVEQVVEQLAEHFTARVTTPPRAQRSIERSITSAKASADEDLLALLQALLPKKRYLRDLGIETLPLARLNTRLAPLGYVLEAKKVRNQARFVACLDADGRVEPCGRVAWRPVEETCDDHGALRWCASASRSRSGGRLGGPVRRPPVVRRTRAPL